MYYSMVDSGFGREISGNKKPVQKKELICGTGA